jgi:hypothetical protein
MLQQLVLDWRLKLQQPDLIFGAVTLAPWYHKEDTTSFPNLRLQQINLTHYVSNTFIVNNLDCGDYSKAGQVHSPYKQKQGERAANGIASMSGLVSLEYLSPTYNSSSFKFEDNSTTTTTTTTLVVTVILKKDGLYDRPILVDNNVSCPATANSMCESFEVMEKETGKWHKVSRVRNGRNSNEIELIVDNWSKGVEIIATRAMFSNWPLVLVRNALQVPLLPWWENITMKH